VLSLLPLTAPEVRRLLLALMEPPERFSFRLAWSHWRRHHQAIAKRCHAARRERQLVLLPPGDPAALLPPRTLDPGLSAAAWQRVRTLLPPPRPGGRRPPRDHRQVLAAMLFLERTGCSWRALPSHFGPWKTVHSRYQRWRKSGLWAAIHAVLDQTAAEVPAVQVSL
jgi:hypothetical protein